MAWPWSLKNKNRVYVKHINSEGCLNFNVSFETGVFFNPSQPVFSVVRCAHSESDYNYKNYRLLISRGLLIRSYTTDSSVKLFLSCLKGTFHITLIFNPL